MQLGSSVVGDPRPAHLAEALARASERLGHRPAVTLLLPDSRQEQSYASLAQWASKGAHFLTLDLLLEPGDRLRLDAPPSWGAAAVALAAWWAGITVDLDGESRREVDEVAIVHEGRPAGDTREVLWLGDGFDGAPLGPVDGEPWVHAVQSFPDQPPASTAHPGSVAVVDRGRRWTHAEVVERGTVDGVLGLDGDVDPFDGLIDTAVHPLLTGSSTVVLRGVERERATQERVAHWR